MKNKLTTGLSLLLMIVIISSCATSRKYGCPSVSKIEVKNNKA